MALVGTADLILRRATLRGVGPASFMVLQSWFFGSTALTWTPATGGFRWHRGVLLGPVAGVLAFVATYAFLRSLQSPGAQIGVNAAIYRLNLAVTALLAITVLGLIVGQFCALTTIATAWAIFREGGVRFSRSVWAHAPVCGALNSSGRILLALSLPRP